MELCGHRKAGKDEISEVADEAVEYLTEYCQPLAPWIGRIQKVIFWKKDPSWSFPRTDIYECSERPKGHGFSWMSAIGVALTIGHATRWDSSFINLHRCRPMVSSCYCHMAYGGY
jgi:hypothetical protein